MTHKDENAKKEILDIYKKNLFALDHDLNQTMDEILRHCYLQEWGDEFKKEIQSFTSGFLMKTIHVYLSKFIPESEVNIRCKAICKFLIKTHKEHRKKILDKSLFVGNKK